MENYVAVENSAVRISTRKENGSPAVNPEQGFALVNLLILVPLLLSLFFALSAYLYILKRKSLAQAACVHQAAVMQNDLKGTLEKLLRLNPRAKSLRAKRAAADKGLKAALSSANPYVLAAAKAYWTAVVLQQTVLRGQQQVLLREAERQRQSGYRNLLSQIRAMRILRLDSRKFYWRALAVEARPLTSLTPDYQPLPLFAHLQQHRFRFLVDLQPPFLKKLDIGSLKQFTECAVTLEEKENAWNIRVLAASARWKPS